jgi:septin 7
MEEEKRDHSMKLKKMEADMEQVFETKVREKKQKLRESEADVSCHISLSKYSVEPLPSRW